MSTPPVTDPPKFTLLACLEDIRERLSLTQKFLHGVDKAEFMTNRLLQEAVIRNVEVIGEAAWRMTREHRSFQDAHPEVPWRELKDMRNNLVHGYHSINLNIVWDTVSAELPVLMGQLPELWRDALSRQTR